MSGRTPSRCRRWTVIGRCVAQDRDNIRARQQLAKSYSRLGQTAMNTGQAEASSDTWSACRDPRRDRRERGEQRAAPLGAGAGADPAGRCPGGADQLRPALASAERATQIYADLIARFPSDRRSVRNLVLTHQAIGDIHERLTAAEPAHATSHRALAAASYRRALDLVLALRASAHLADADEKMVQALRVKVSRYAAP